MTRRKRTRTYEQTSANIRKRQQLSANVSTHVDFVLEKSFSSAIVSECQQMSVDFFSSAIFSKMMMTPAYPI
jgi:hypothetical protein